MDITQDKMQRDYEEYQSYLDEIDSESRYFPHPKILQKPKRFKEIYGYEIFIHIDRNFNCKFLCEG